MCPVCGDNEPYAPICGDNGKTYSNACWMRRDACILRKPVSMVKNTACSIDGEYDVVYAIDGSQYVTDPIFKKIKEFVQASIQSYTVSPSKTRIALLVYNNQNVNQALDFTSGVSREPIDRALTTMSRIGGERGFNTVGNYVLNNIFTVPNQDSNRKRIFVLLTTGVGGEELDVSVLRPFENLQQGAGADVISVVIGDEAFLPQAHKISLDKQNVIFVDDYTNMPNSLGHLESRVGLLTGRVLVGTYSRVIRSLPINSVDCEFTCGGVTGNLSQF